MIKKLFHKLFKSAERRTVVKNMFSLSILQGLNLLLPLLTYPYLIRVLGKDLYGTILHAAAITYYFQMLTEYSFHMTATKDVSVHANDTNKLHSIFNEVFTTKMFLLAGSSVVMAILVFTIPFFEEQRLIYLLTFGNVIGLAIFPVWFFQGLQKMKYITYFNFICKVIFTAAIFVFVKKPQDAWLAPLFTSCGYISAGIVSLIYIKKLFKIPFQRKSFKKVKEQLKIGRYLFLSELKISLFTNTNTLLLGFIAGEAAVAYFASAEKVARAIGNIYTPVTLALFPYMVKNMNKDKASTYSDILKITKIGSLLFLVILIPSFIWSDLIMEILFGKGMENASLIFRILLFIPVAAFIDNMFGKQVLLTLGKDNLYFRVISAAAALNLTLNLYLTYQYSYRGTAVALIITHIFISIGMYWYAKREVKRSALS